MMMVVVVMTTVSGVTSTSGFARSTLCTCGQTGRLHHDDDGDDDDDNDDGGDTC